MGPTKRGFTGQRRYWRNIRSLGPLFIRISIIWAGGILLLCVLLYYLADEELGRSFYSVHLRLRNTWQILLPAVLVSGGVSFLAAMAVTFLVAVRESQRWGGPAFKLRRLFQQLAEGYLDTDFRFRKGDMLVDIGESYRAALEANKERIAKLQELSRRMEWKAGALSEKLATGPLAEDEKVLLGECVSLAAEIRNASAAFHVGAP